MSEMRCYLAAVKDVERELEIKFIHKIKISHRLTDVVIVKTNSDYLRKRLELRNKYYRFELKNPSLF